MKRIVFCLPGAPTLHAAESWDDLRSAFAERPDLRMTIVRGGGSSVMHVRNQMLETGVTGPKKTAKPFGGQDYDFMMWIDSDTVYRPEDFFRLLELDVDVAGGAVPIDLEPGRTAAGKIDLASGETGYLNFGMLPPEPMEVGWCGFAFLLVKRGVFEALNYPWFDSACYEVGERTVQPSEDIRWCLRVREKGFKIVLDPRVRLGHEKLVIMEGPEAPATVEASLLDRFIGRYDRAWRMSRPAIEAIVQLLEERKPKKVLELGPGASSFAILPWCLEHGSLYRALDHVGPYALKHLENLQETGLPLGGTYVLPLDRLSQWYEPIHQDIESAAPYDLVIVDGPVEARDCPDALAAYKRWGHAQTAWVFDDVNRQQEREAAASIANANMRMKIIRDPDYPRQTCLLIPDIDVQPKTADTVGNSDAEAIGQPASRGNPKR